MSEIRVSRAGEAPWIPEGLMYSGIKCPAMLWQRPFFHGCTGGRHRIMSNALTDTLCIFDGQRSSVHCSLCGCRQTR
jgi:hypothetical protein